MKKQLIAGLATVGFVLAASSSAWADHGSIDVDNIEDFYDNNTVAISLATLSNTSSQYADDNYVDAYYGAFQGVKYGDYTFEDMAGINSNGVGVNAGTGQSQVIINAAATVNLDR